MDKRFVAEQQTVRQTRRVIRHRYAVRETVITLVVIALIIILGVQLWHAHQERQGLNQQAWTDRTELASQQRQRRRLRLNVTQLHNRKYVEQLLSARLAYSKPGETVYNLPGSVAKDVTRDH